MSLKNHKPLVRAIKKRIRSTSKCHQCIQFLTIVTEIYLSLRIRRLFPLFLLRLRGIDLIFWLFSYLTNASRGGSRGTLYLRFTRAMTHVLGSGASPYFREQETKRLAHYEIGDITGGSCIPDGIMGARFA